MKSEIVIFIFAILAGAGAGFSEAAFRSMIMYYAVMVSYTILKEKL